MEKFIITTTPYIENAKIEKYLGVVVANEVLGVNIVSEFISAFSDGFGGRSGELRRKFDELNSYVQKDLQKKATRIGANAVIGYEVNFNEITGKGKQMFMASASGTAVLIDNLKLDEETTFEIADFSVSDESVDNLVKKEKILTKLSNKVISNDEWGILDTTFSLDTVTRLLHIYFDVKKNVTENTPDALYWPDDIFKHLKDYINRLDFDDAVNIIYPLLADDKKAGTGIELIKEAKLFNPQKVYNLLTGNEKEKGLGFEILQAPKKFISASDLPCFDKIDSLLKLEEQGSLESKSSMFGTKYIFRCPDGHESNGYADKEYCYCKTCGKGIYGFTAEQYKAVTIYKERYKAIKNLLSDLQK